MNKQAFFSFSDLSSLRRPTKIFPIVFRNFNGNINPAINCCNPNFIKGKTKGSLVKVKRHKFLERWFRTFIPLHRFKSLRSNSIGIYNKLRRQIKPLSCFVITKMVKLVSVVSFRFKAFVGNIFNSFRIFFHSFKNKFVMRNFQLNRSNGFHTNNYVQLMYKYYGQMSSEQGGLAFLPHVNVWVSSESLL